MKLRVLSEAQGDAIQAACWYDDQRAGLGDEFLTELNVALQTIRDYPDMLSGLDDYTGEHDIYRTSMRRFPYSVIVLRRSDEMVVTAIAHMRRRPLFWLHRLGET